MNFFFFSANNILQIPYSFFIIFFSPHHIFPEKQFLLFNKKFHLIQKFFMQLFFYALSLIIYARAHFPVKLCRNSNTRLCLFLLKLRVFLFLENFKFLVDNSFFIFKFFLYIIFFADKIIFPSFQNLSLIFKFPSNFVNLRVPQMLRFS